MKIVDEKILDGAITSLADAIRERGHFSEKMTFPDGFISKLSSGTFYSAQKKYIMPKSVPQLVTADSGYDAISEAIVYGDANIKPENIQRGVSLYGVEGTLSGVVDSYLDESIEYDGGPYKFIRRGLYENRANLKECYFPNASYIGSYAFSSCISLVSISAPACESIHVSAFYKCSSMKSAIFEKCVYIGNSAFSGCSSLEFASFPNCQIIESNAFEYCPLSSIYFPECKTINGNAFQRCSHLVKAYFPKCEYVGYAFERCSNLEEAIFPESLSACGFGFCSKLYNVSFPKCKKIEYGAFQLCSNLSFVSFPKCEDIQEYAFYSCINLRNLFLYASTKAVLSNINAFYNTPSTMQIHVPDYLYAQYTSATNWSYYSSRIVSHSEVL